MALIVDSIHISRLILLSTSLPRDILWEILTNLNESKYIWGRPGVINHCRDILFRSIVLVDWPKLPRPPLAEMANTFDWLPLMCIGNSVYSMTYYININPRSDQYNYVITASSCMGEKRLIVSAELDPEST